MTSFLLPNTFPEKGGASTHEYLGECTLNTTIPSHPLPYLPSLALLSYLAFPTLCSPLTCPLASPALSLTLPYPSGLSSPYPAILSSYYFSLASPPLPTYPRTPILPLHSLPSAPLASPPHAPPLPYHIHSDWSRDRNVSFSTSTLTLLSPTVPTPPPTLRYPSTSYLSTPLPWHPIHSAHLPCPNPLSYLPLSHLLVYPTLPSPPVYPALPKDSEKNQRPRCFGTRMYMGRNSLVQNVIWRTDMTDPQPDRSRNRFGPKRLGAESSLARPYLLCNKTSGAKWLPCNATSIGRNGLVPKCLATGYNTRWTSPPRIKCKPIYK